MRCLMFWYLIILIDSATAKICKNITVQVDLSTLQPVFNVAIPETNLEVTDFILNMTQQGRTFSDLVLSRYQTTTGRYNISTQLCAPSNDNSKSPKIQVLIHGVGMDKTYWDLPFNNFNYSYVNVATDQYDYYTLSFDRLGVGSSSHGDPLNEIQIFLEVAATAKLTTMLRDGTFPTITHPFTNVFHVGHSLGSFEAYLLASMYPDLTDAIVLTGFSMDFASIDLFLAGGNFQLASLNQPLRFGNEIEQEAGDRNSPSPQKLPNGYITSSDIEANKYLFFKPHHYDPEILEFAEKTKQPATLGELLTIGGIPSINNYTGPVMIITGDADLPFCGSNCFATGSVATSIPAMAKQNFPNSKHFLPYVQPNTAHGINFHYNATGAYEVIQRFLDSDN